MAHSLETIRQTARLMAAAQAVIDAFGGDVPSWLAEELAELHDALVDIEQAA